jgi:hypothetical protein
MALTGMITGILSVLGCWCCGGFPVNLLAIIFSIVGLVQISNSKDPMKGKGMAITGLVCGIVGLILGAIFIMVALSDPEVMEGIKAELNKL